MKDDILKGSGEDILSRTGNRIDNPFGLDH